MARTTRSAAQAAEKKVEARGAAGSAAEAKVKAEAEVEAQFNGSAEAAARQRQETEAINAALADYRQFRAEAAEAALAYEQTLTRNLELAQAELRYGADSVEVQSLKNEYLRAELDERMRIEGISEAERDRLLAIYDQTADITAQTAAWADRMAGVAAQVRGVAAAIAAIGGGMIANAARATELEALRAGHSAADAARMGQRKVAELEFDAREAAAGSAVERWLIRRQRDLHNVGLRQEDELIVEQQAALERERAARSGGRGGGGGRGRSGGGRGNGRSGGVDRDARDYQRRTAEIEREIGRLRPSYERDVAAARKWRDEALAGLDQQREGYAQFAADVEAIYQERLGNAYEADLKRRGDWAAGVERGFNDIMQAQMTWADLSENLITGFAKQGEAAFLEFGRTGKASVDDLLDHMRDQFLRALYQMYMQPLLNSLLNSAVGAIGGVMGAPAPGAVSLPTAHTGGRGVMRTYSGGNRPRSDERLAMLRDGEEVFTPRMLENGAAVVQALSAMAAQRDAAPVVVSPNIQIVNRSGTPISGEVEEATDSRGQRQIRFVMDEAVAGAMSQPGGRTQKAALARFGMKPKGHMR